MEAIKKLLPPTTRSELRGFLGLAGYYREFVAGFAAVAKPLTTLLKEDVPWQWDDACQQAFTTLQSKLAASPILAMPEPDRPFQVHTDFSKVAASAVLEQLLSDGKWHVVAYASRNCSAAEAKLGPTDGELLALVYALEKFHPYIAGSKVVVVTDHAALVHLQEARNRNPKLARWAMRLASYDFTVKHRAGHLHSNADGLSRCRAAASPDTPQPDQTGVEVAAAGSWQLTVRSKVWMRLPTVYMLYPKRHFHPDGRPVPTPLSAAGLPHCEDPDDLLVTPHTIVRRTTMLPPASPVAEPPVAEPPVAGPRAHYSPVPRRRRRPVAPPALLASCTGPCCSPSTDELPGSALLAAPPV